MISLERELLSCPLLQADMPTCSSSASTSRMYRIWRSQVCLLNQSGREKKETKEGRKEIRIPTKMTD